MRKIRKICKGLMAVTAAAALTAGCMTANATETDESAAETETVGEASDADKSEEAAAGDVSGEAAEAADGTPVILSMITPATAAITMISTVGIGVRNASKNAAAQIATQILSGWSLPS